MLDYSHGLIANPDIILIIIFIIITVAVAAFLVFIGILSFKGKSNLQAKNNKDDRQVSLGDQVRKQSDQIDQLKQENDNIKSKI